VEQKDDVEMVIDNEVSPEFAEAEADFASCPCRYTNRAPLPN
jgi:hypothetical protein